MNTIQNSTDIYIQVYMFDALKWTQKVREVIWPRLYAPPITPQDGLMIHCDVQIVIGWRKTPDYAQHFFLQPIY